MLKEKLCLEESSLREIKRINREFWEWRERGCASKEVVHHVRGKGAKTRSLKQEVLMPQCDSLQIGHVSELRLSKLLIGHDTWWSS